MTTQILINLSALIPKKSKLIRISFLVYLFLLNNFASYAQRVRDYGRDYSDLKPTYFSREQILTSFLLGPLIFWVGLLINKHYVDEKGNTKTFLGVIIIWIGLFLFIPALQFILSLIFTLSLVLIALFIVSVIVIGIFAIIFGKSKK